MNIIKRGNAMVVNRRELEIGTRVERKEHGFNLRISRKIAMDHIKKHPKYYSEKNKRITSINNGHRHTWKIFDKRTSVNSGHSHPIDLNNKIAKMGNTKHTHRLLIRRY